MFTIKGCFDPDVIPRGFVRNASTVYLLSLLMNVNDSTSAICFPARTSEFKFVSFLGEEFAVLINSCPRSEGPEKTYAIELSLLKDQEPTKPRSLIMISGGPPATGKR